MTTRSLRPCVGLLLRANDRLRRCKRERLHVFRFLLVAECRRAGFSREETVLTLRQLYGLAWPDVSDGILAGETDRFAAWAFRQPCFSITCGGIRRRAQHLCDEVKATGGCGFGEHLRMEANQLRQEQRVGDLFEELGWPEVLRELHGNLGQVAARCFLGLRERMVELDLDYRSTLFVPMRALQEKVGGDVGLRTVFESVHLLLTEGGHGLVERVVKGLPGRPEKNQAGRSAGYRIILPSPAPPRGTPSAPGGGDA